MIGLVDKNKKRAIFFAALTLCLLALARRCRADAAAPRNHKHGGGKAVSRIVRAWRTLRMNSELSKIEQQTLPSAAAARILFFYHAVGLAGFCVRHA
ncbi:MAG TPA: hypothetical protein VF278_16440 [Pirellulales bacterium]